MLARIWDFIATLIGNLRQESGFNPTPLEITVFLVLIGAFVALLLLAFMAQRGSELWKSRSLIRREFRRLSRERGLSRGQARTVRLLAGALPRGTLRRHRLLTDSAMFSAAAERALERSAVSEEAVAALRVRLGFTAARPDEPIHSTAEIAPGSRLLLAMDRRRFYGTVTAIQPEGLVIRPEAAPPPEEGEMVHALLPRSSGVFSFASRVCARRGEAFEVEHRERVDRVQRRRYYRRQLNQAALVLPASEPKGPLRTTLTDIGGGGAGLVNPGGRLKTGDRLRVLFLLPSREKVVLAATVVNATRRGRHLHVSFDPMPDPLRDRIVGFSLKRRRKEPQAPARPQEAWKAR